jgi:uncharacterized protein YaiL (DUF2058 family)
MSSLQDQLLKAGIVDEKKAKKIKQEKRKAAKQQPKGAVPVDENREEALRVLAAKAERDRQINRQNQAAAERKAVQAQIKQLIEVNRVERGQGEIAYQFSDGVKIKKLYVTDKLQQQLVNGRLAIVRLAERYELVPAAVAQKIRQRDTELVLVLNSRTEADQQAEDDPYADYQIPDDLMW